VRAEFLQTWLRDPNGPLVWRSVKEIAGFGALGDLGSHMIDSISYITGAKPKRAIGVHAINVRTKINLATGKRTRVTADTDAQFMVHFGSFVAFCETSQVETAKTGGLILTLSAEKGTVRVGANDRNGYEIALDETGANAGGVDMARVEAPEEFRAQGPFNAQFFLAIQRKTRDYPTFEDGYVVQKTLDAIARSARTNRWESISGR
jgi:predicted dehydrogenase